MTQSISGYGNSLAIANEINVHVICQALCRDVRGLFNKITPEKFDELCVDFLALKIYAMSDAHINGVIGIIFDKAVEEPKYCEMYR
jgi:translation initiation factor 4G